VHNSGLECEYLFIDIPSLEVLRQRLTGRGTDSEETINKRMKNAVGELEHVARLGFYHRIMNDELETCFVEVCGLIEKTYHIELKE
jgi:guanylate kinase